MECILRVYANMCAFKDAMVKDVTALHITLGGDAEDDEYTFPGDSF
jgi:hypothetical protein